MNKILKLLISFCIVLLTSNFALSKGSFFEEALKLYENKKYNDARFLFERNIVFNPKDADSYLYLAKIYNFEDNQRKEEFNLKTTLQLQNICQIYFGDIDNVPVCSLT